MVDEFLGIILDLTYIGGHHIPFLEPGDDVNLFWKGCRDTEGKSVGVFHGRGSDRALFCGYEYDSVFRSHTVDGGRCILEH